MIEISQTSDCCGLDPQDEEVDPDAMDTVDSPSRRGSPIRSIPS